MQKQKFLTLALVAWSLMTATAEAHAVLQSSQPQAEAKVTGQPVEVVLHYNSRIDAARCRLLLQRPDGSVTALLPESGASPADLKTKALTLAPGPYQLHWEVLSVDGHVSRGDLPFSVVSP